MRQDLMGDAWQSVARRTVSSDAAYARRGPSTTAPATSSVSASSGRGEVSLGSRARAAAVPEPPLVDRGLAPDDVQDKLVRATERNPAMAVRVRIPSGDLNEFCQRWTITELALFGSALREDFDDESDIDVLVSFAPGARWSLFDLVTMQSELETLFGRSVDLVERSAIERSENYIRRKSILSNTEILYAAG